MSAKTEVVTINVAGGIMKFLEDIIPSTEYESVKDYLEEAVRSRVEGDIENNMFTPKLKEVVKRHKLEGVIG